MPADASVLYDGQMHFITEEKRFVMNALSVIARYLTLKKGSQDKHVPRRVIIFAGRSMPEDTQMKNVINFLLELSSVINKDEQIGDRLKCVFLPNYDVSLAEKIMPALDVF